MTPTNTTLLYALLSFIAAICAHGLIIRPFLSTLRRWRGNRNLSKKLALNYKTKADLYWKAQSEIHALQKEVNRLEADLQRLHQSTNVRNLQHHASRAKRAGKLVGILLSEIERLGGDPSQYERL